MIPITYRWFLALAALLIGAQVWAATDAKRILGDRERAAVERTKPAALDVTIVRDPSCADCATFDAFLVELRKRPVEFVRERVLDLPNAEADAFITTYGLTKLPALLITGEVGKRAEVSEFLARIGASAGDAFVANALAAPYVDVATKAVVGRLWYTKVMDGSCGQCYDVNVHDRIISGYGVPSAASRTVDIASADGRALVAAYRITAVPTFILEGELDRYPALASVWSQVGTREGAVAVFRTEGVAQMGTYRELPSRRVVVPKPASAPSR